MTAIVAGSICCIACHGNSADHFATFAQALSKEGISVQAFASGPALKRFQDRSVNVIEFSKDPKCIDGEVARIVEACSTALAVIVDVGDPACIKFMRQLSERDIRRIAYYDNPESFVPGGYSTVASQVIECADTILSANSELTRFESSPGCPISLKDKWVIGLGYYPIEKAEGIKKLRTSERRESSRKAFFKQHDMKDTGQKIVVYFGGNNAEYFDLFPFFLSMIEKESKRSDLSDLVFVLQQHPGAKLGSNKDGLALDAWEREHEGMAHVPKFVISKGSTDDAQVYADEGWYHQTSMGPQLVLEGLPTAQVPGPYGDILVRNGFAPSIETPEQFHDAIVRVRRGKYDVPDEKELCKKLGIRPDWVRQLKIATGLMSVT
jgi:hypothetical protein